jgi:AcrR family transcriptional regulator
MATPARAEAHPLETGREGAHVVEMQRRRLLLAMEELAGEDGGLADATVGAVCKRSRVSRRTFYELFDDRDDCFLAAFEHALEQVARSVLPACEGAVFPQRARSTRGVRAIPNWRERIRAGLEALLAAFDEQPQLARLCVVETLKGGPAILARRRELLDRLAEVVDEGRREARAGTGPPPLTAESVVGGVLAVIHARLLARTPRSALEDGGMGHDPRPLVELAPALTAMIVLPYLGQAASQRELERPATPGEDATHTNGARPPARIPADPFRDMPIRITYRTARVLAVIAAHPGASNRRVGDEAGASDQGQVSKLLKRLEQANIIENQGPGRESGEPNAWKLTAQGQAIHAALGAEAS